MTSISIDVITVTLNSAGTLRSLVDSLLAQEDQNFRWILVDGGSTDSTLEIASAFPCPRLKAISEPDFSIYHALNKALAIADSSYYLVVGSDDHLEPDAIKNYRAEAARSASDIISAPVRFGKKILMPQRGRQWLRGGNAYVSSHSVGSLIRRDLHAKCGYYSNRYVNAADMEFLLRAIANYNARVSAVPFVAGRFGSEGVSTADELASLADAFRIQLAFGEHRYLQLLLYILRLLRVFARWRTRSRSHFH